MTTKKYQNLSITALFASILPLATFIPTLLNITLTDKARFIWTATNILSTFVGLVLSIICVKAPDGRSTVSVISMIISSLWIILMAGIVALAFFLNFLQ